MTHNFLIKFIRMIITQQEFQTKFFLMNFPDFLLISHENLQ